MCSANRQMGLYSLALPSFQTGIRVVSRCILATRANKKRERFEQMKVTQVIRWKFVNYWNPKKHIFVVVKNVNSENINALTLKLNIHETYRKYSVYQSHVVPSLTRNSYWIRSFAREWSERINSGETIILLYLLNFATIFTRFTAPYSEINSTSRRFTRW